MQPMQVLRHTHWKGSDQSYCNYKALLRVSAYLQSKYRSWGVQQPGESGQRLQTQHHLRIAIGIFHMRLLAHDKMRQLLVTGTSLHALPLGCRVCSVQEQ